MIKVLIVDDSPLMRKFLTNILNQDKKIEVIGTAPNGKIALEKTAKLKPDLITLDVEMPVMNGIKTLKRIMSENPLPVIMISSYTETGADITFKALDLGAVDFITKPDATYTRKIIEISEEIIMKVKAAYEVKVNKIDKGTLKEIEKEDEMIEEKRKIKKDKQKNVSLKKCKNIISIGISTGGPDALKKILPTVPEDINAGIVIVQHMPPGFTKIFSDRMNSISKIHISEAEEGDIITHGRAFIARGDHHLLITSKKYAFITHLNQKEKINLFRPSIDVLMQSCSENFHENTIGVIMTGMAHDGVAGIKIIKTNGGKTIAQDQKSSIVYGMNKLAVNSGYVDKIVSLEKIIPTILNFIR